MSNILIRGVPASVHATLQERAERNDQSLQQYLVAELTRHAERQGTEEGFNHIDIAASGIDEAVVQLSREESSR